MKFKILFMFMGAALVSGCAAWISQCWRAEVVSAYAPRSAGRFEKGTFNESLEYMRKMRGSITTGDFNGQEWTEVYNAVLEHDHAQGNERDASLDWFEMGPDNFGGRTRAILAVDDNLLFAGGVTGGLWKSTNGGNFWTQITSFPMCSIGSIDRTGDGTIYVGTGSAFDGTGGDTGSASMGNGLYRSTDGGETWELVPGTGTVPYSTSDNWIFVNDLCADPAVPDKIWIAGSAGVGYWQPGMSQPQMGGSGLPNQQGQDIDISPDGTVILVAIGQARIYRSSDSGASFTQLGTGAGLLNSSGRARVAIAPQNPDYCYVLYATNGGNFGGLYSSTNKGANWSVLWPTDGQDWGTILERSQGIYDLCLVVSPCDAQRCMLGGITLWQAGLNAQPEQLAANFAFEGSDIYVHSDVHTFEVAPNGNVYIGTDGGIFMTNNCGSTFTAMNRGFNVTQFYGIAHSAGYPAMGGTQDNGTIFLPGFDNPFVNVTTQQQGLQIMGGDGFDCEMSQITAGNSALIFASSYYGSVNRFNQTGSGGLFYDNDILNLTDPNADLGLGIGIFYTPMRFYEDTEDEDSQQYIILENPTTHDLSDTTFTLYTLNQNLPFEYTLPPGFTLHYWPELVRPAFTSTTIYENDPNYWWLPPQTISNTTVECEQEFVGNDTTFTQIPIYYTVYWTDTLYFGNDTIVVNDSTQVIIGYDTDTLVTPVYQDINCVTYYHYAADVLTNVKERILIQDQYTTMFVTGFTGSDGIWLTRQAANLNTTPDWWKIVNNAPSSGVKAFEFTRDGNTLFYSSWSGGLFRVSGLKNLWSAADVANLQFTTLIPNAGSLVTGIASDPNDPNHLVITVGGFGTVSGGKVQESTNALSATPTFSNIWFNNSQTLAKMPCYDVVINAMDPSGNTIVVGTEYGVYATDTGTQGSWTHQTGQASGSSGTIGTCPTFAIRQQQWGWRRFSYPDNYGRIWAGTHGRGIFMTDEYLGIKEPLTDASGNNSLLIYPNPAPQEAFIDFQLQQAEKVVLQVLDMKGRLVLNQEMGKLPPGAHKLTINTSAFVTGNYVVVLRTGSYSRTGKLLKMDI